MRKLIGISVVILFISFSIQAQKNNGNFNNKPDFTPEQTATLQTKRMTLQLDLNEGQQTEIYALVKQNVEEREKTKASFKQKKQDGVQLTSDEKFELQSKRLDKQIERKAAMKKILSKEQFEAWEKMAKKNLKQHKNASKKQMKNGAKPNRQF